MKIIATTILTTLIRNPCFSFVCLFVVVFLSFLSNQKQESHFHQVGGLVTGIFLFFVDSESYCTSKLCQIQDFFLN